MTAFESIKQRLVIAIDGLKRRPYVSLSVFVLIVILISAAGYARYQHVQAELAAQQNLALRIQQGFDDWLDDLKLRLSDVKEGLQGTAQGATNIVGGAWGIVSYLVSAVFDFIGNLHIMIPVTVLYVGVGFFGTMKMRAATLLGAIIAFFVSTRLGIVPGSVIGLFVVAGLLFGDKLNPRLLSSIQELPFWLKGKLQRMRDGTDERHSPVSAPKDEQMDTTV